MKINNLLTEITASTNIEDWHILVDTEKEFEAELALDNDSVYYTVKDYDNDKFIAFATSNSGVHRSYENNTRKSLKILSSVIAITRYYIKKYLPKNIVFYAEAGEGKDSLYNKLANRIKTEGGYDLEITNDNGDIIFYLTKSEN